MSMGEKWRLQPRSQGLSSYRPMERAPGGGKMRDLRNEVVEVTAFFHKVMREIQ